ncbi:hypothetical protein D3C86_1226970 [compost metagenome]
MPIPVSRTQKCNCACSPAEPRCSTPSTISPCSVNFVALLPRLISTWPRRNGSPIKAVGSSASVLNSNSRPLSSAFRPIMLAKPSRTASRWKGMCSRCILPASILEKSRMSLMITNRYSAERWTFSM